jgi:hypothetical protein
MNKVLAALVALVVFGVSSDAGAWLKYKNNTTYGTIWTAHAYDTLNAWPCGDEGCNGYKVRAWWGIGNGGVVTVYGGTFYEGHHQAYGFTFSGYIWRGSGSSAGENYRLTTSAQNHCGEIACTPVNFPACQSATFYKINAVACCGLWPTCSGYSSNHTFNFNP